MSVTGIGGVFFSSPDPERLYTWYVAWIVDADRDRVEL